jgi:DNA-binding MarR family transcriptional regulator
MEAKPSPQHLRAWRASLTAHSRIVARMADDLEREVRLPLPWYEVLLLVRESPTGQLRMHELADSRLLSRSAATRLIDRMELAGLVSRIAAAEDRRGTLVELTDQGLATLRTAAPIHLRGIEEYFAAQLSADEAAMVEAMMQRMVDALAR